MEEECWEAQWKPGQPTENTTIYQRWMVFQRESPLPHRVCCTVAANKMLKGANEQPKLLICTKKRDICRARLLPRASLRSHVLHAWLDACDMNRWWSARVSALSTHSTQTGATGIKKRRPRLLLTGCSRWATETESESETKTRKLNSNQIRLENRSGN